MAIGPLKKPALCWSRYRDANPVPTIPLADEIATALSGPVRYIYISKLFNTCVSTNGVIVNKLNRMSI